MADTHDIGEIWATVQNQGEAVSNLATQVGEGFKSITKSINDNHEKTDRRISELAKDTSDRFETVASTWQRNSSQRSASMLTTLGIIMTAVIGIGGLFTGVAGLGFTAYTLIKAPVDQSFASIDRRLEKLDAASSNFVPKDQINITEKRSADNKSEIDDLSKEVVSNATSVKDMQRDVNRIENQVTEYGKQAFNRDDAKLLSDRLTVISQRLQTVFDKNFAVTSSPVLQGSPSSTGK